MGAGVVGLATAHYLRKLGHSPVLFDAGVVGGACSKGNGGWICPSTVSAVMSPKADSSAVRDPVYAPSPMGDPELRSWLSLQRRAKMSEAGDALYSLAKTAVGLMVELEEDGLSVEWARSALLVAFKEKEAALSLADTLARRKAAFRILDAKEALSREPFLKPVFARAIKVEGAFVRPESLCTGIAAGLTARGVRILERTKVTELRARPRGVALVTPKKQYEVDRAIIAAGVHSGALARQLGQALPLTAAKGYSVTVDAPSRTLRQPVALADDLIYLTPFSGRVRFAGLVDFTGINDHLDPKRIKELRHRVDAAVSLRGALDAGLEWVGMRPTTPDSLPLIGRLLEDPPVYVNTGHQKLGITLALGAGRALAQLIAGKEPWATLKPFLPDRFELS